MSDTKVAMDAKSDEERNIQELQAVSVHAVHPSLSSQEFCKVASVCLPSCATEPNKSINGAFFFHLGMQSWHSSGTWGASSIGGAKKKLPTKQNP